MNYIYAFLFSFCASFLLTPAAKIIASRMGIVARPKDDRWHKNTIPLLGGAPIFLSFIAAYFLFLGNKGNFTGLVVGASAIFILGFVDDLRGLTPQAKIIGQIVCAALVVLLSIITKTIPFAVWAIPLAILWMVGIANSFNLLDNMDGLSCGIAVIASFTLFVCSFFLKNYQVALMAIIVGGAALGFLPHNFFPAKIFMGDCGAMFLGFVLAALAIEGTLKQASHLFIVLLTPLLALAVPIFDTAFVAITRKIDGRSVVQGGKDHASHRLVFLGLPEKKAVLTLYAISVLFGIAALTSLYLKIYVSVIIISLLVIFFLAFGVFLGHSLTFKKKKPELDEADVPYYKDESELIDAIVKHKRVIFEIICDFFLICLAYASSYVIRYEGFIDHFNFGLIAKSLPIIIVIKLAIFYFSGVYGNIWRYIGLVDLLNITKAVVIGSVVSVLFILTIFRFEGFSRMIFVLDAMALLILMSGVRVAFRLFREHIFVSLNTKERNILIMGAGDAGDSFLREIRKNKSLNYRPVGFIDDDREKLGRRIQGIKVLGNRSDIPNLVKEMAISEIIISIPSASQKTVEDIKAICREAGVNYRQLSGIYVL
ncbi:MAG: hypothetical protein V1933_06545 [Candidatus Omnitrophota bacterium]